MLVQHKESGIPLKGKEHLHKNEWIGFLQLAGDWHCERVDNLLPGTYYLESDGNRGLSLWQIEDKAAFLEYYSVYFPTPPCVRVIHIP